MNLSQMRELVHSKVLAMRCVDRLIITDLFGEVYQHLDFANQTAVVALVMQGKARELRTFIRQQANKSIETMGFDDLRMKARMEGIPMYSRMSKIELIHHLKELVSARTK